MNVHHFSIHDIFFWLCYNLQYASKVFWILFFLLSDFALCIFFFNPFWLILALQLVIYVILFQHSSVGARQYGNIVWTFHRIHLLMVASCEINL